MSSFSSPKNNLRVALAMLLLSTSMSLIAVGKKDFKEAGLLEPWKSSEKSVRARIKNDKDLDPALQGAKDLEEKHIFLGKNLSRRLLKGVLNFESKKDNPIEGEKIAATALNAILNVYSPSHVTRGFNYRSIDSSETFNFEETKSFEGEVNTIADVVRPFFVRRLGYNKHHRSEALHALIKSHKDITKLEDGSEESKRNQTFYTVLWQGDNEAHSQEDDQIIPGAAKALRMLGGNTEADSLSFEKMKVLLKTPHLDPSEEKLHKIWTRHVTGEKAATDGSLPKEDDYQKFKVALKKDDEFNAQKIWFLNRHNTIAPLKPNFVTEDDKELEALIINGAQNVPFDLSLRIAKAHYQNMLDYNGDKPRHQFVKDMRDGREKLRQLWLLKFPTPKDKWENFLNFRKFVGATAHLDGEEGEAALQAIWESKD